MSEKKNLPGVWRVFNGRVADCRVHRIVVAQSEAEAIRLANAHGFGDTEASADLVVMSSDGVETEDFDS